MAQFQNRCFSGPLTLDRYLTGGSDSGPLPHLANILVGYTRDHPVEALVANYQKARTPVNYILHEFTTSSYFRVSSMKKTFSIFSTDEKLRFSSVQRMITYHCFQPPGYFIISIRYSSELLRIPPE